MAAVFLSYSHQDKHAARGIAAALAHCQIPYFRDIETLRAGDRWVESISEAISSASDVILLWSKSASSSEPVRHEWTTALSLNKRLIIARLDKEPLPAALAAIHAVDADDYESILRGVSSPPDAEPRPAPPRRLLLASIAVAALIIALFSWMALRPHSVPAPTLSGFVQDEHGDPVSDVRITLPEENQDGTTNQRGRFELTLGGRNPKLVRLIATKDCYETWTADAPVGETGYSFVMRKATCSSGKSSQR